jgi:hypothetical protein
MPARNNKKPETHIGYVTRKDFIFEGLEVLLEVPVLYIKKRPIILRALPRYYP